MTNSQLFSCRAFVSPANSGIGITLRTSKPAISSFPLTFLVESVHVEVGHDQDALLLDSKLVPLVDSSRVEHNNLFGFFGDIG